MKNIFNAVQMNRPKSSKFDLSHDKKMSLKMGQLIPMLNMECLPGDKIRLNTEMFLRFSPLISPVMHRVRATTHFYFVPSRILWPSFERWITGQSDVEAPYFTVGTTGEVNGIPVGTLGDYMGLPTGTYAQSQEKISSLSFAAYLKIWDEYYRDQNLQTEVFEPLQDGAGSASIIAPLVVDPCLNAAWEHDYFTSCLPFAQKGDAVQIPLTSQTDVPVEWTETSHGTSAWKNQDGSLSNAGNVAQLPGPAPFARSTAIEGQTNNTTYDPRGSLTVDIQSDATDINTLRRAFRLQEWLERNARGGTRYIESILAHFGIRSSDARLQRPEYLGGSKQNMVISEVLSTTFEPDSEQPLGALGGHGISVGNSGTIQYSCEEHGFIIGVVNIKPDTAYYQGIHKSFQRFDRLDYAWPTFANIGEQEVLTKEIFGTGTSGDTVFGYIPRYAEYKTFPSNVAGDMRDTLEFWHMGRKFSTPPALNEDFIKCVPTTRIFAVEDSDQLVAHLNHRIDAIRPLPKFGIPTI